MHLITNATTPDGAPAWLIHDGAVIVDTGAGAHPAGTYATVHDARGGLMLPGAIDAHVHMRQPGATHKATIATETRAALAGGVTTVVDMPNNTPPATDAATIALKRNIAATDAATDVRFMIGATGTAPLPHRFHTIPGVVAVKVFMGSSTGNLLVDNDNLLEQAFAQHLLPVVVHAEDETIIARARARAITQWGHPGNVPLMWHSRLRPRSACTAATQRAIDLARRHGTRLHIAHVTTADEANLIARAKQEGLHVTAEVSPHHLTFTHNDMQRLGARIKMNPCVKTSHDRTALRQALRQGIIDIIATDHAPHLPAEKQGGALTAASGAPMVQFALPLMLDIFDAATVQRAYCQRPAQIFGLDDRGTLAPGQRADITIVHPAAHTVTDNDVLSLCAWTPLDGTTLHHTVTYTHIPKNQHQSTHKLK